MTSDETCPEVPPASPKELEPLLSYLQEAKGPPEHRRFTRGTLLPDGRLDLCKQGVGVAGMARLKSVLKHNTQVRSLLLGADSLGDEGALEVAELVRENKTLSTVFLGCNHIQAKGAAALAFSLKDNRSLRGLWLKRNPIGPEGARCLATVLRHNSTLRTLDLVHTGIGPTGLKALVEVLIRSAHGVERLYLGGNGFGPEEAPLLAELIEGCSQLKELYLSCGHLGDRGVLELAEALPSSNLTALSLASNGLTSQSLAALTRAGRGLVHLDLGYAPSTQVLNGEANRVGDEGARILADWLRSEAEVLERLDLSQNGLTPVGAQVLLEALPNCPSLAELRLGTALPESLKEEFASQLEGRRCRVPPEDVAAVRSVYRVRRHPRKHPEPAFVDEPRETLDEISEEDLTRCSKVLELLAGRADLFWSGGPPALKEIRAQANRLIAGIKNESRSRKKSKPKRTRDQRLLRATEIYRHPPATAERRPPPVRPGPGDLSRPGRCYICKADYREVHFFYPSLCPECAAINYSKRSQRADLRGRRAAITGGRIKIGHLAALKLLRCGAEVFVTTRFPVDAARRFAEHEDFLEWKERLTILGLDLRDLPAVEKFATSLATQPLDILINNAAQTIRRPPEFYETLLHGEHRQQLPPELAGLVSPLTYELHRLKEEGLTPSAVLTQRALSHQQPESANLFPVGFTDADGVGLDFREANSWTMRVEEVPGAELLEVHLVNALAPFLLVKHFKAALLKSTFPRKFVVNVSAMEGSFSYHFKGGRHAHTNMAKAALNMMTRTLGESLAKEGIYLNSVDTGWVTNENPYPVAETMAQKQFAAPLDLLDGAARVCDPILTGVLGMSEPSGCFLKDYRPVDW